MSIHRTFVLALVPLLASSAFGSEFSDRLAAWQGGATAPPAAGGPAAPQPPPDTATAAPPRAAPSASGPRAYPPEPSGHIPGCTTCGSGPSFIGPSCDGVAGCCGPGGCGGYGCGGCGGGILGLGLLGHGCCHSCGDCYDYGPSCCNTLVWARFEVLMWWRQGRDFPPLVTTDPVSEPSTTAGILPDATILFGGERVGSRMQAGGRFDLGWWMDPRQCWGVGWRFWGLGQDSGGFNINSLQNPVLAIPFTDAGGQPDALLIAYPGLRTGSIDINSRSEVLGNDVYGRFLICRDCDSRLDFITGWHYARINDSLVMSSSATTTEIGGDTPVGTVTDIRDEFNAHNEFNGGILGLMYERNCGCWNTQLLARMSLGANFEETTIRGATQIASPNVPVQTENAGLFAADSNSGTFSRSEFTAITEVGLRLGYRWGPCTQLSVGYTFIYWNDAVTAPEAIDPVIGTDENDQQRPRFAFRHSDYWVQGINLGIVREF